MKRYLLFIFSFFFDLFKAFFAHHNMKQILYITFTEHGLSVFKILYLKRITDKN